MRTCSIICILLCFIMLLSACGGKDTSSSSAAPASSTASQSDPSSSDASDDASDSAEQLPPVLGSFSAEDLDGNAFTQDHFKDYSLVFVNLWTTYCGYCIEEMPYLKELSDEYASKGVLFLGIVGDTLDMDGNPDAAQIDLAKQIVAETGADYTHLVPTDPVLLAIMSQLPSVPSTFLVDSSGSQVGSAVMGMQTKENYQAMIDAALEELGK